MINSKRDKSIFINDKKQASPLALLLVVDYHYKSECRLILMQSPLLDLDPSFLWWVSLPESMLLSILKENKLMKIINIYFIYI